MTSADAATPARSRLRRLARAVACGLVVALVVMALALLVRTQFEPLIGADRAATRSATDVTREHPGLLHLLLTWQRLSSARYLYVVATLACLWVWSRHHLTTRALWAFVTMMVGWNLTRGVKDLVQRARPVVSDPVSHAQGFSFPSGHSANATIASMTVVLLLWPILHRSAARVAAVGVAAVLVLLTCLDRVFLGVHFPSDVTAGVLLGVGFVGASYVAYVDWRPPVGSD